MEWDTEIEKLTLMLKYDKKNARFLCYSNKETLVPIVTKLMNTYGEYELICRKDPIIREFLELIDGNGFNVQYEPYDIWHFAVIITWNQDE